MHSERKSKHRKILRDNIQGLTNGRIRQICMESGQQRVPKQAYEWLREHVFLPILSWQACQIVAENKLLKRTTIRYDIVQHILQRSEYNTKTLIFRRQPFQRWIREVCQKYQLDLRFSSRVMALWQQSFEEQAKEAISRCDLKHLTIKRHEITKEWLFSQHTSENNTNIEETIIRIIVTRILRCAETLSFLSSRKYIGDKCIETALTMNLQGKLLEKMREMIRSPSNMINSSEVKRIAQSCIDMMGPLNTKARLYVNKLVQILDQILKDLCPNSNQKLEIIHINTDKDLVATLTGYPV